MTSVCFCLVAACGTGTGGSTARLPGAVDGGESGATDGGSPPSPPPPGDAGASSDGGIGGDGGTPPDGGPVSCASPAPADVCQRLNPPLGAPVVHRESEVLSPTGDGVSCGTGAYPSSGTGVVLHRMQPDGRPPRLDFVDRTGAQVGTLGDFSISTFELAVVAQTSGFAIWDGYLGGLGTYPLTFVDDHGVRRAGGTGGAHAVDLPDGGAGIFRFEERQQADCGDRLLVQRFEDTGTAALRDPTDLGCTPQMEATAMAGNGTGNVLVLVSHTVAGWDAYWLDADLRLLQKFTPAQLAAEPDGPVSVSALLDGSFAIRFGAAWRYRIQPGATTFEPAPCWLAERPATTVTAIRSRGAYAVTQLQNESSDRTIEVLTSKGQSCGDVSLGGPTGHCDVAIGRDGTITRSAYAVDAGPGNPAECVLQFWPGALGPSGF